MKISGIKKTILQSTVLALIIILCVLSQIILFSYHTSQSKILPGVYVNDLYVGGMTTDEARDAIENELSGLLLDNNTTVINGDIELVVHASNIANVDVETLVENAYYARRDKDKFTYFDFLKMKFTSVNVETSAILDWYSIYDFIEMNQHMFYVSPVDAQLMDYSFVDGQLKAAVSQSQVGYEINIAETATAVQQALLNHESQVNAVMKTIEPQIDGNKLIGISNNPITYSQIFPVEAGGVYQNIPNDLSKLNDFVQPILIMPAQTISIKDYINFDNYSPSIYSVKQLHIPTVIYGCAMHVGLYVVEHHVSDYITDEMDAYPLGQEAILGSSLDLLITNNFDYPVILDLEYDKSNSSHKLNAKIYCVEQLEYTYIKSVIEEHDGLYHVKVYRVYANDTGGVLSRTLLEEHTYPIPPPPVVEEEEIVEELS